MRRDNSMKVLKAKSKAVAIQFYNVERVGNSVCSINPFTGEILKDFKPGRTKFTFDYVNPASEWTKGIKADFECAFLLYLSYTQGNRDVSGYETLTELVMDIEETRELFEEYIHNFVEEGIVMEYMKYSMKRARFLK